MADDALPGAAVSAGLSPTFEHITLIREKQETLRARQIDAEGQFLHRIGQLFAAGEMSEADLARTYRAYSKIAIPGFMRRWNDAVHVPAQRMQHIYRDLTTTRRHVPNMPDGTWRGPWPIADGRTAAATHPCPAKGICVVYVLYDASSEPCYVGSSENLKARLKAHAAGGKAFTHWSAHRCVDREAAYRFEEKLLAEYMPYLNKKRYR